MNVTGFCGQAAPAPLAASNAIAANAAGRNALHDFLCFRHSAYAARVRHSADRCRKLCTVLDALEHELFELLLLGGVGRDFVGEVLRDHDDAFVIADEHVARDRPRLLRSRSARSCRSRGAGSG
jgi:hypothetical protein